MFCFLKILDKVILLGCLLGLHLLAQGCAGAYESRHEGQWDSKDQLWMSEASQVKVRSAQSRVFDTTDRTQTLKAVIATLQDLNFQVDVVDEELGMISGKKLVDIEGPGYGNTLNRLHYTQYDDNSLLFLSQTYRSWGPFYHRNDLVRITVTVRPRGKTQLLVRASSQFYLRAIEDPEPYQIFFRSLEQALFLQAQLLQ